MRGWILGLLLAILLIPAVYANPSGATINAGTPETTPTPSPQSTTIEAGQVNNVNVSTNSPTQRWAGFWGEVSGNIVLSDSSSNIFYQWALSDPTGSVVWASTASTPDWTTLAAARATDMPTWLNGSYTDNWQNTFTNYEDFATPTMGTISAVNYTTTWQGGAQGTEFKTYSVKDGSGNLLWAALVNADKTSFNSVTADYQLLVPEDPASGTSTYYFWLEIA